MRKILFRGRRTDGGGWAVGSLIKTEKFCCILDESEAESMDYPYLDSEMGWIDGKVTPVIPKSVGQYTGFTDKNGNKIFEGDIVKYAHGLREVVKDYGGFYYPFIAFPEFTSWDATICEVIGNIEYTPELLKGGADND